jgi:hypothetical protein
MDILNFISWIKAGNYREKLPIDVTNLLAVGSKDPNRDDAYLPMAINAAPLQSLYNKGTVTQLTSITTPVTINSYNGVITTVSSTIASLSEATFIVNNDKVTTTSVILLTALYSGNGNAVATIGANIANGAFKITIANTQTTALNAVVKIHFMIIN